MRNVVVSLAIFVIMIIAMSFSISYLNKISLDLGKFNNEIEQHIIDNRWDEAYKISINYAEKWKDYSKSMKPFVSHQELDNIEIELWKLPQYVKEKTKDESLASVHALKFLVDHISKLQKINFQNVF